MKLIQHTTTHPRLLSWAWSSVVLNTQTGYMNSNPATGRVSQNPTRSNPVPSPDPNRNPNPNAIANPNLILGPWLRQNMFPNPNTQHPLMPPGYDKTAKP